MSADFLSQDEVDALLKGVTGESDEPEQAAEAADALKLTAQDLKRLDVMNLTPLDALNKLYEVQQRLKDEE